MSTPETSLTLLDDDGTHGDAFNALTTLQKRFVLCHLVLGGRNAAEAARVAGYASGTWKQSGYALLRKRSVIAALREEAEKRMSSHALTASENLLRIVGDATHKDNFKATIELMNRAGLQFIQKHEVIHTDHRLAADVLASIVALAVRTGQPVKALLGYDPEQVTDAEVEEVEEDQPTDDADAEFEEMLGND